MGEGCCEEHGGVIDALLPAAVSCWHPLCRSLVGPALRLQKASARKHQLDRNAQQLTNSARHLWLDSFSERPFHR